MLIKTHGIVLKRFPFSETSLICKIYTRDMGKISILAKGAWKQKNSIGPLFDPLNHLHIQYYNKTTRDVQILKDASFVCPFSYIRNNLSRIIIGLSIVEIIDKSTIDNNPYPVLYRLGFRVLQKLNEKDQAFWLVYAFFLYQFSLRLGFMPNIHHCSRCNNVIANGGIDETIGEIVCSTFKGL